MVNFLILVKLYNKKLIFGDIMEKVLRSFLFLFLFTATLTLNAQNFQNRSIEIQADVGHIIPNTGFVEFNQNIQSSPRTIFKQYYKSFGLNSSDAMQLVRTDRDDIGMRHYRFRQQYNNVPVFGAEFIIHERPGRPYKGNGFILPNFKILTSPAISSETALASALNEVNAEKYMWQEPKNEALLKKVLKDDFATFYPKPQLMIIGPNVFPFMKEYRLAYKIDVYAEKPLSYYSIFVDAQTGEIITKFNNMQFENETGTAVTMYHDTVQIVTDHFPGGFRLREIRNNVAIVTLNAHNTRSMQEAWDFTDTDNFWNNINDKIDQTATDAHWSTEQTVDYYKQVHNRNSIDGNGMDVYSLVHVGVNWYNASWNGAFMSYGDGNNNNPLTKIEIVGHELTHGVTQYTAQLIYAYESGALNESFSDVFGASIGFWSGITNPDGSMNWYIGGFRDMADPNKTGQPDTYKGKNWKTGGGDNGGVHTNSQVQNHWYYIICEGESGVNDNNVEYDVKPVGIKKGEKIAYRTLTYYLFPSAQYADARSASLEATADLYGMCSEEYKNIADAWYAVGVGTPIFDRDIGVSEIVAPKTSCDYLSKNERLILKLKYYGCGTLISGQNIKINMTVDKGDTLTENYSLEKDLHAGETVDYRSKSTFDFSKAGKHTVDVWVDFPNDSNLTNNSKNSVAYSGYGHGVDDDLALVKLLSPVADCGALSDKEKVSVAIVNNSCNDIASGTSFDMIYELDGNKVSESVTLDSPLLSKDTLIYEFNKTVDLSAGGQYDLKVTLDYSKDPFNGNNVITNQIFAGMISEFPYLEGFEKGQSGWQSKALSNNNSWQWGKPGQTFIDTASGGKYAWMTGLRYNYFDASDMVLMSPCFDLSNFENPNIKFDAIFKFEKDFDGMVLEYSTDNENWQRVEVPGYNSNLAQTVDFGVPWFSGTNNGWKQYSAFMPELTGEPQVRFRFRVGSDANLNDEGAAIDNFAITSMNKYDLMVNNLIEPVNSCNLTRNEKITAEIKNFGSDSLLKFDISYSIDGGAWVSEKVEDTIAYNEAYRYTFAKTADLSSVKKYSIKIAISLPDDADPSNNNKTFTVENKQQMNMPISEDFETGKLPDRWSKSQTGNSKGWAFSDAVTENKRSGGKSWPIPEHTKFAVVNDISINYNRRNDRLIMPPLDLTNTKHPTLYFDVFYTDLLSSVANIEISEDNGATWTTVDSLMPVTGKWRQKIVDLSKFKDESCLLLAFKFDDAGVKSTGICIDNVELKEMPTKDCAVNGIFLDEGTFYTNKENVFVRMQNKGTLPFDNSILKISYTADGKPADNFTETLGEQINPGETILHKLNQRLDFSDTVDYYMTIYQMLGGDKNYKNDTIANVKINTSEIVTKYPYKESFTNFTIGKPGKLINGWLNDGREDLDWWVNRGATPTYYTGPSLDHTGSNGRYMYVESSYPFYNMRADLLSPIFDVSQLKIPYLKFWYQMLSSNPDAGDVMGSLHIDVYDGTWHNDVFSVSGNQGSSWKSAEINLRDFGNTIKIRFRGLTGPMQYSDIALDDIEVYDKKKVVDIGISALPKNGCGMTNGTDIPLTIKNNGTEDITGGIDIIYKLDNNSPVKERYTDVLKSGKEIRYLIKDIVLSKGTHHFDFIINTAGDQVHSNDTVKQHPVVSYTDIFNYDTVTVCEGLWAIVSSAHIRGFDSFHWHHDASVGQVLYADSTGMYTVSYDFENGCTLTDSVYVNVLSAPTTGLNDMIIPAPKTVDAGDFESYLWQDGSGNRTYYVDKDGLYYVTVSDKNGCFGTDAFEVKIVVSVDDDETSLKTYPNPVSNFVHLQIKNNQNQRMKIELIDIKGVTVYSDNVVGSNIDKRIDVSGLASGVYLLKVSSAGVVRIKKIIVN